MIKKVVAGFSAVTLLTLPVFSQTKSSAVKTDVKTWSMAFANALENNKSAENKNLLDFRAIESKVVPSCIDCVSQEKMKQARQSFEKNDLSTAEKLYNEIPKSSDSWFEAVEERGWIAFRQDRFESALAQSKTLLSPQFASIVNAEAYLLQALSQLRICDYEGVLKTNSLFKDKQKNRITEIQNLIKTGQNQALIDFLSQVKTFPLDSGEFTSSLSSLPGLFYRDIKVQKAVLNYKLAEAGINVSEEMDSNTYKNQLTVIKKRSFQQLKSRIKELAQAETNKNFKSIQSLNLIEVEVIQRIHHDLDIKEKLYSKESNFKDVNSDKLVFMDDGHPWIDELDKYEVKTKSCDKNIRRKM